MGLIASIYKSCHGVSNLNVRSFEKETVCIVNAEGPFEPRNDNAVIIELRNLSAIGRILTAYPAVLKNGIWVKESGWFMNGGTIICTSDSRFSECCEKLLGQRFYGGVHLHDRKE